MHDHKLAIVSHPKADWLHPPTTMRLSVTGSIIDVFGPQTIRTVVSVTGSEREVRDDGTTSQTPERCLTRTKPFSEEYFLNIRSVVYP